MIGIETRRRPHVAVTWAPLALAAVGWLLLAVATRQITEAAPITGYEPSLYEVFPISVFAELVLAVLAFGLAAVPGSTSLPGSLARFSALIGIAAVAAIQFYAPWLRGYEVFSRGDLQNHLAAVSEMTSTGLLQQNDFYPGARVVATIVKLATGLETPAVFAVGRFVMTLTFMAGSALLARVILRTSRWDGLVAAVAGIPIAGAYAPGFVPAEFSIALSPALVALIVLSARRRAPAFVMVMLAVGIVVSHPLVAAIDVLFVGAWGAIAALARHLQPARSIPGPRMGSSLLILAALFAWLMPLAVFRHELLAVRDVLVGEGSISTFVNALGLASRAGFGILDSARLALSTNAGIALIYVVAFPLLIAAILRRSRRVSLPGVSAIVVLLLSLAMLTGVAAVGFGGLDLFRFVLMSIFVAPVSLAVAAALVLRDRAVLAAPAAAGIFAVSLPFLWSSPMLFAPSDHIPPSEKAGIAWLGGRAERDSLPVAYLLSVRRIAGTIYPDVADERRLPLVRAVAMPDHFDTTRLSAAIAEKGHILVPISEMERVTYTELWGAADRFNSADFQQLEMDSRVSKPFADSHVDIYLLETSR